MRKTAMMLLAFAGGCTTYAAPVSTPVVRDAATVGAPIDATWAAALQTFAEVGIPIASADRASGRIEAEPVSARDGASRFADCGRFAGSVLPPSHARYSAAVAGDHSQTRLEVAAAFSADSRPCISRGVFEVMMRDRIAARAEGQATLPPSPMLALQLPAGEAMVIVESAAVRARPSVDAAVVRTLPRGWRGRVGAILNGEWFQFDDGFVHVSDLLQG